MLKNTSSEYVDEISSDLIKWHAASERGVLRYIHIHTNNISKKEGMIFVHVHVYKHTNNNIYNSKKEGMIYVYIHTNNNIHISKEEIIYLFLLTKRIFFWLL